jgi:YVTN family beta-propeller protein
MMANHGAAIENHSILGFGSGVFSQLPFLLSNVYKMRNTVSAKTANRSFQTEKCMKNILRCFLWLVLAGALHLYAADLPRPLLLVLDKPENKLVMVDPTAKKIVGQVATGTGPHELTVSADGKLAFVANYGDQTPGESISVIDLEARKELRRVNLGALRRPHGMVQYKGKIYFTAEVNKAIVRYDPAADRVDWMMGTGQDLTHMLVINKDQNKIYTANIGSDSVGVMEPVGTNGNWHYTVIPVGKRPEGIDLSPDGKEVWTAHSADGGVSVIDTETKKIVATIPALTKHSNRLKFTPDGKLVLVSDAESNQVLAIDVRERKLVKRIPVAAVPLGIQITPDGRLAYVACAEAGQVAIVDLSTLTQTGTIDVGPGPDGLAWVQ